MIKKLMYALGAFMLFHSSLYSSVLLHGDPAAVPTETFSFPLKPYTTSPTNADFYVGALADGAQAFAISKINAASLQFFPLAPGQVSLNYVESQPNPLFSKGIALLDILSAAQGHNVVDRVVAVSTDPTQAATIFLVEQISPAHPVSVLTVDNVTDANAATTSGIISISATSGGRSGVFAAVKPHAGGIFGDPGSGVALIQLNEKKVEEGEKSFTKIVFEQIAADALSSLIKAVAVDKSSSFIKINNNLSAMTDVVDLYWDSGLQRLFVALQGTGGAGATDGLRAVLVGRVDTKGILTFEPIAPTTVFDDSDEIVGGVGSNAQVSMHKVRVMHTSTGLDYLIVVGGNGAPSATQQLVFGLPLVNTRMPGKITRETCVTFEDLVFNEQIQGTLANKNKKPIPIFSGDDLSFFLRRDFVIPATTNADIYTSSDFQAQVGGGPLAAGPILDIVVMKDAVFVNVGEPADPTQKPGVFYSQALFNGDGTIENWTQWQRVAGTTDKIFGISYEPVFGNFTLMSGADATTVRTVRRTAWGDGSANGLLYVGGFLSGSFPPALGGIQGLFDFPRNTPGLTDMSILAGTGLNKVILIESGAVVAGAFTPNTGDFLTDAQEFPNGIISPAADAKVLVISGGALNDLGPIVSAEIAVSTTSSNGWLFVGGANGLAVLSNKDGSGWNSSVGLQPSFVGLADGMSFKKIDSYNFVRAMISDNNFLYVLTDSRLDRIDLTASNFSASAKIVATTLATLSTPSVFGTKGTLLDIIVSQKFALLSTTDGLYRIGNGKDIRTVSSPDDAQWTGVVINEGTGSAIQLISFSATGRIQDVALSHGGDIYALNGFTGKSRGQVNRFFVADVASSPISSTTLQPVPDIKIEGTLTYFRNFGGFANQYATNGALQLFSRSRNLSQSPFVKAIQTARASNDITIPLNIASFSAISRIMRNSATGSWMIAGDFMRFNE